MAAKLLSQHTVRSCPDGLPSARRSGIDAYEELAQDGAFGEACLLLLHQLVSQEARRFPVLRPQGDWTKDDVWELVQEFYSQRGTAVTVALLTQATDVDSMSRFLRKSIKNFLVDQARRTPRGSIRRKVEDLLARGDGFVRVPPGEEGAGRWMLRDGPAPPFNGSESVLINAAYAVAAPPVRWTGTRNAPMSSDANLQEVLRAVFEAAAGSLAASDLAAVFAQRFPLAAESAPLGIDGDAASAVQAPLEDQPAVSFAITESASAVYEQLTHTQRALIPHLASPVEDQMKVLGRQRSQTMLEVKRVREVLRILIPDDEMRSHITEELLRLCVVNP